MSASTAASSVRSFLDLPPELRLIIYHELAKDPVHMWIREQLSELDLGPTLIDNGPRKFKSLSGEEDLEARELVFDSRKSWRSQDISRGDKDLELVPISISSAPILVTCRLIRQEALCEFTRTGHLHLSIPFLLPLDLRSLPQLKQIQHLSVDYTFVSPEFGPAFDLRNGSLAEKTECELAQFIHNLAGTCRSLRTLALYIQSDDGDDEWRLHVVHCVIEDE